MCVFFITSHKSSCVKFSKVVDIIDIFTLKSVEIHAEKGAFAGCLNSLLYLEEKLLKAIV